MSEKLDFNIDWGDWDEEEYDNISPISLGIKYIYFEQYNLNNNGPIIQNENILYHKPKTNTSGFWGFMNVTKSRNRTVIVNQYWVDFEKYDWNNQNTHIDDVIHDCVEIIINKIQ